MSYTSRYQKGDWKAICDSCGREFKASRLKQRWDGLMVCPQDYEVRHPQDFVRGVPDSQIVPWVRDEASDTFTQVCYTYSGVAGWAIARCAITAKPDYRDPLPQGTF